MYTMRLTSLLSGQYSRVTPLPAPLLSSPILFCPSPLFYPASIPRPLSYLSAIILLVPFLFCPHSTPPSFVLFSCQPLSSLFCPTCPIFLLSGQHPSLHCPTPLLSASLHCSVPSLFCPASTLPPLSYPSPVSLSLCSVPPVPPLFCPASTLPPLSYLSPVSL